MNFGENTFPLILHSCASGVQSWRMENIVLLECSTFPHFLTFGHTSASKYIAFPIKHIFILLFPQLIPLGLLVLGLTSFKTGRFDEMFDWGITSAEYGIGGGGGNGRDNHMFPPWAREVGGKNNSTQFAKSARRNNFFKKNPYKRPFCNFGFGKIILRTRK